jgi:hypothetical protein
MMLNLSSALRWKFPLLHPRKGGLRGEMPTPPPARPGSKFDNRGAPGAPVAPVFEVGDRRGRRHPGVPK